MSDAPTSPLPAAPAKQDIPDHVLPFMEQARALVRSQALNPCEKSTRRSEILHCSCFESANYDHSPAGQDQRNRLWAEFYALEETKLVSDLTPERRAVLLKRAHELLPDAERYSFAYQLTKEIEEENLGLEEPSRTCQALKARATERLDDISDQLSNAILGDDYAFAAALYGHGRRRPRFHFRRIASWGHLLITDIGLKVPYVKIEFSRAVEWCETIRDIKRACVLWDVEVAVQRRDGMTIIVGPGFEIHPK